MKITIDTENKTIWYVSSTNELVSYSTYKPSFLATLMDK